MVRSNRRDRAVARHCESMRIAPEYSSIDEDGHHAHFHALRHSYVTALVRSGATVKQAQVLARHSTPVLTLAV